MTYQPVTDFVSGLSSVILSGVSSGTLSGISSDISFGILSYILALYLAYLLAFYLVHYPYVFWSSIWHILAYCLIYFFLTLTFYLANFWRSIWLFGMPTLCPSLRCGHGSIGQCLQLPHPGCESSRVFHAAPRSSSGLTGTESDTIRAHSDQRFFHHPG